MHLNLLDALRLNNMNGNKKKRNKRKRFWRETYAVLQQPVLLSLGLPEEALHLLDLCHVGHTGTGRKWKVCKPDVSDTVETLMSSAALCNLRERC